MTNIDQESSSEPALGEGRIHPQTGEYEFGVVHDALFSSLARTMMFVGAMLIFFGVLGLCAALLEILGPGGSAAIVDGLATGLQATISLALGIWTRKAAGSFRDIATTEGTDMTHLSFALEGFRKIYKLQYFMMIFAIAVLTLLVVLMILA